MALETPVSDALRQLTESFPTGTGRNPVYSGAGGSLQRVNPTSPMMFPKGEDVKPYSGLPESYRDTLLGFVMPQLQQSVTDLPGNIDAFTQNALSTYRQQLDMAMKDMLPRQIGNLANRGILNSSVASDTLSQVASDASRRSAGMGYQTAMEAARMKTAIPQTLGELLKMGASTEDPTVMYRTIANLIANEM